MLLWTAIGLAQMPGGRSVQISHTTQVVNGRRFLVHVVEQGQTVYAISRAYGLKEIEAVTKKDIHFLQVGDTVWLPCKGQRLADGTTAPKADGSVVADKPASTPAKGTAQSKSQAQPPAVEEPKSLGPAAVIRPRVNSQSIVVSLMMPLNLSQMDKISTSKFDVEQRGKVAYKSLEFIQFYEGLILGLERLESMGYNVTLNVVDVEDPSDAAVEQAFRSHNVAQSDLLIAMLTRQPFQKVAELARAAQLFVVNPVSDRFEIVEGNPYVFKCMPSREACAKAVVASIHKQTSNAPVIILHSNAKSEKTAIQALTAEFAQYPEIRYTLFDWAAAGKFSNLLKSSPNAVVVSVYDQEKSKKRIFVQQLLNKLSAYKSHKPVLYTFDDWSAAYSDIDFAQLQSLNYHTFFADWDMDNPDEKAFVDTYKERFKTEPTSPYAGMANDIILYFVTGLQKQGTDFFKSPSIPAPRGVMSPLSFSHNRADYGFENQSATLYRMSDYHFTPVQ